MTNIDILEMKKSSFNEALQKLMVEIPVDLVEEEITSAGKIFGSLLTETANKSQYISVLLIDAKRLVREYKRIGDKEKYEDMVDKRDALEIQLSALKLTNQSVSRLITLRQIDIDMLNICDFRKG